MEFYLKVGPKSLNIENEETQRLAGELASITGDNSCVTGGKVPQAFRCS